MSSSWHKKSRHTDRVLALRELPPPEGGTEAYFAAAAAATKKAARGMEAPVVIVEAVKAAVEASSFEEGLQREAELFMQLSRGEQARRSNVFFAERQMSKVTAPKEAAKAAAAAVGVAIVGAGTMGGGIAMLRQRGRAGDHRRQARRPPRALDPEQLRDDDEEGRMSAADVEARMGLLTTTSGTTPAVANADLVIEAAFERMAIQRRSSARSTRRAPAEGSPRETPSPDTLPYPRPRPSPSPSPFTLTLTLTRTRTRTLTLTRTLGCAGCDPREQHVDAQHRRDRELDPPAGAGRGHVLSPRPT